MSLTLESAVLLLKEHHLLREIVRGDLWTLDPHDIKEYDRPFSAITYDSREVKSGSILVAKGQFREEYFNGLDDQGLACYVATEEHHKLSAAAGLIVEDASKALCLLASEFYGRPQDELTLIGVTGTKGKTTTCYFTQAILNAASGGRAALFSSVDNCLDGHTYEESNLTTPESLDAFRMMRQAVDNGMKYLIMEVSSQAYKVSRVYGLTFDVGAFLNISSDHISPIEHPTFEDYLYCKRQITANSRALVLGADHAYASLVRQDAAEAGTPVTTFALDSAADPAAEPPKTSRNADFVAVPADAGHRAYHIMQGQDDLGVLQLKLDGDFNYANAAAALAIAHCAGIDLKAAPEAVHAIEPVRIAGRMEEFRDPQSDTLAIVDYAHNYASVTALLDFVDERFGSRNPRITLVTGSAGNKAYDRRKEIVEAAQHRISNFIFTAEDTNDEPFIDICIQMQRYITVPTVTSTVISDRPTAVTNAIYDARAHGDSFNVILIIGKGNERWIKDHNRHVPFEGDDHIVERMFAPNNQQPNNQQPNSQQPNNQQPNSQQPNS